MELKRAFSSNSNGISSFQHEMQANNEIAIKTIVLTLGGGWFSVETRFRQY